MRNEFGLIEAIVEGLGDRSLGDWIAVGPGDDAAVILPTDGLAQVASIDTLLPNVHFPVAAPAELIGYRALMVSFSDLAAMGALPRYCLVSLSIDDSQIAPGAAWVVSLARGMAQAARQLGVYVCGGNLTRGPLNIAVSVHGEVDSRQMLMRSNGSVGQGVYVTGHLGAAAACVRRGHMLPADPEALTFLQRAYYRPQPRFNAVNPEGVVRAGIDISDGLCQDLAHLCVASGCGAQLEAAAIPIADGALLEDALYGGDDYELLLTCDVPIPGTMRIGILSGEMGLWLDGEPIQAKGFDHFRKDPLALC